MIGMCSLVYGAKDEEILLRFDPGGHTAMIRAISFFDHGKKLIFASDDKAIRIWDVSDLKHPRLSRTIRGETGTGPLGLIYAIALDPQDLHLDPPLGKGTRAYWP